jgi:hypothetical protein
VFDGGVQPEPIFSVFHRFQYKYNPGFLPRLQRIVKALPYCLGPLVAKIEFNRVGISEAIAAGTVRGDVERDDGEKLIFKPPIIDFGKAFMIKTLT